MEQGTREREREEGGVRGGRRGKERDGVRARKEGEGERKE